MSEVTKDVIEIGAKERALLMGDLSKLSESDRGDLYANLCKSLGLNPLTNPFSYMQLKGKWMFYASKSCTDQLRSVRGISVHKVEKDLDGDLLTVIAYARDAAGREDQDCGVVDLTGLRGEARANAVMKAMTKAKRRVTLSICGLGMLDESEIESIPDARTFSQKEIVNYADRVTAKTLESAKAKNSQPNTMTVTDIVDSMGEHEYPKEYVEAKANREQAQSEADKLIEANADPAYPAPITEKSVDTKRALGEVYDPGDFIIAFGKNKGRRLSEVGKDSVKATIDWIEKDCKAPIAQSLLQFKRYGKEYLSKT